MELIEVIKKRRSICRFKPDEISKEDFMILDVVFYSYKQQEGVEILFTVAGRIRNLNS